MGDDIIDPDARLGRRTLVDRRDDSNGIVVHNNFEAEPKTVRNLQIAEGLPIKVERLGVEHADHAIDGGGDQFRLIELVNVVGPDTLERGKETVALAGLGRRRLLRDDRQAQRDADRGARQCQMFTHSRAPSRGFSGSQVSLHRCCRSGASSWRPKWQLRVTGGPADHLTGRSGVTPIPDVPGRARLLLLRARTGHELTTSTNCI